MQRVRGQHRAGTGKSKGYTQHLMMTLLVMLT